MSQFSEYMGGGPGDGFTGASASASMPTDPPPVAPPPATQTNSVPSSVTTTSETQALVAPGSITQYASQSMASPQPARPPPPPQSYAERSAQAYAATGGPPPIINSISTMPPTSVMPATTTASVATATTTSTMTGHAGSRMTETPTMVAHQNRILTDATRKVQEHAYYMRQGMDRGDLPVVLDRASRMLGELGEHRNHHHHHGSSSMVAQPRHDVDASQLNPKNYYELHMRVLDEIPNLEEYLLNLTQKPEQPPAPNQTAATLRLSMKEMYHAVQYCPRALSRLYLQICAGSALIRSHESSVGAKWVLKDLLESVKCVQCPLRGLFLRHYLLQALRDKLPDNNNAAPAEETVEVETTSGAVAQASTAETTPKPDNNDESEPGTVVDAYEFVLANFIAMNKLWVRIQHLPGDGKSKEQRKRRERERNELRILVGTNLVRLSQLEGVTSQIYGEVILPTILEQIVSCGDPLAQAYLIDCIIQVFPDEYHIETLPILLGVCPKLRDKVNIRTILQSLMDRLANYYADEELLDETDTNQVKKAMAKDSFLMFEDCVQKVYNARGPNLHSKEVIRLQTALLNFSLKCYPGNMGQVNKCLKVCVENLRQVSGEYGTAPEDTVVQGLPADATKVGKKLDDVSVKELGTLLSIPLDSLALKILELDHYSDLLTFLPWDNRRDVAMAMVKAIDASGGTPRDVKQIDQLFTIIAPVVRDEDTPAPMAHANVDRTANLLAGLGVDHSGPLSFGGSIHETDAVRLNALQKENALVSKLVHLLDAEDTDIAYEMLTVARKHLSTGGKQRIGQTLVPLVFSALRLVSRVYELEFSPPSPTEELKVEESKSEAEPEVTQEQDEAPESTQQEGGDGTQTEKEECPENNGDDKPENEGKEESTEEGKEGETTKQPDAPSPSAPTPAPFSKSITCRKIFVFLQKTVSMLAEANAEVALKLYLQIAVASDTFSRVDEKGKAQNLEFAAITYELITQAFILHEEEISDSKAQQRCIVSIVGALMACRSIGNEDYESLITKAAQYAAKMLKKPEQCRMVSLCSHLFYRFEEEDSKPYRNPQRVLECLQRGLKLADTSTMTSPSNVNLFVDLLEHYLYFFERGTKGIEDRYISGLIALIKEHLNSIGSVSDTDSFAVADAKAHLNNILRYIMTKKEAATTKEQFAVIECELAT